MVLRAGEVVSHTWNNPGTYLVEVTATDAVGRTVVKTLTIRVGG